MKTTSELRKFLAVTMEQVKAGSISMEKAAAVQKIAGRINESMYAEAKILHLIAPGDKSRKLGDMELHNEKDC